MIHICFALHDKTGRYSKFTGAAMLSVFENTDSEITVHIIHDDTLTPDNRDKFISLVEQYKQRVKFYNVDKLCADKITEIKTLFPDAIQTRFSIGMFYRFFIPQLLSPDIKKAIYLDADIIVNLNIAELWQIELGDKPLGAVINISQQEDFNTAIEHQKSTIPMVKQSFAKSEDYFNSGVLLMNLNFLRGAEETLKSGMKFLSEHPDLPYIDQDLLNYCFSTTYLKIPAKFNSYVMCERFEDEPTIGEKIYHFLGCALGLDMNNIFNQLWMKYFFKTPWLDTNTIGRIWTEFERLRHISERRKLKISAIVSGKTRAFFIAPEEIESTKKLFSIRTKEIIIPAEDENSIQKLIDAMKRSKGKSVFFIMTENFLDDVFPFDLLTKEGFIERIDFIKGWKYLDSSLDSYLLIRAM